MSDHYKNNCNCSSGGNIRVSNVYYHLAEAHTPLAMSYVPFQQWETPYDQCTALRVGTVFQDLCKPFCGKGGKCW